ncbi:hypothetical protein LIER_34961 [Lithospermum erythrorhizon]|uniref:Tac7077 n=1 Tax=Lithospermum erythrorhizon TaxID=34254 RepID=A0AAV3NHT4_LITER
MLTKRNNFLFNINYINKYYSCFMTSATTNSAAAAAETAASFSSLKRVSHSSFFCNKKITDLPKLVNFKNLDLRVSGCGSFYSNGSGFGEKGSFYEDGNFIGFEKARAFAPNLLQSPLLRDSEEVRLRRVDSEADLGSRGLNGDVKGSSVGFLGRGDGLPERIVVAVDVDEVLGNFVSALNQFIADRYSSNHYVSEYHVYEFFKIWKCSRSEADFRVHEFFKTTYFKKGIHPLPGALESLQKLSRFCDLSIVTSRQNIIKDHTIEWIEKHFPGIFREIHFGNHFALDGQSKPKSDICRELGAKVLIDDNPRYAIECAKEGISVLLFDYEDSYPWSKMDSLDQHPLITKVLNWKEVEHHMTTSVIS